MSQRLMVSNRGTDGAIACMLLFVLILRIAGVLEMTC